MSAPKSQNITWHAGMVTRADREERCGYRSCTIWLTGLSASGKSTIAVELEKRLWNRGIHSYVLDGDNIRHGLNKDLGFSPADRTENIRRIGEVAKLFTDAGVMNITAFISPYRADRDRVRSIMKEGDFIEVFVDCPIEVCEKRDPKGLYEKARAGKIPEFTGISAPYESPANPELTLRTDRMSSDEAVERVLAYLTEKGYLRAR